MVHFLGLPQAVLFLPYTLSRFWDRFSIGKKSEFRLVFSIEIIAASINLMLAFESPNLNFYSSSYGPFSGTATGCPVLTRYIVQILG